MPKWNWAKFLFFSLLALSFSVGAETPAFRFHTFREPESLNPFHQKTSNSGYVTSQLFLPPLKYAKGKTGSGFLKSCKNLSPKTWSCDFIPGLKYSDGSALKPEDFLDHLKKILDPKMLSPMAAELFYLEGAKDLFQQKANASLGVKLQKNQIHFQLLEPDAEFPLRLISPLLSPFKEEKNSVIGTGAYRLLEWKKGEVIRLEPNPHFKGGSPDRPLVEVLFQAEDHVALKLYENKELSFLRRLPTLFFRKYENSKEFHLVPQVRFDYFGFSKKVSIEERKFLADNFPYKPMQDLLKARPRPGCFSLPEAWSKGSVCYPEGSQTPPANLLTPRAITFSQNVEDTKRLLEWFQGFAKDKWKWKLSLEGLENKTFLDRVEQRRADFFRKGLAPDRPSCLAVLENFLPGAAENFIDFSNPEFERILQSLRLEAQAKKRVSLCRKALELLRDQYVLIPTGPIYFSLLVDPNWEGWSLNEINDLDLAQLRFKGPTKSKTSTKE